METLRGLLVLLALAGLLLGGLLFGALVDRLGERFKRDRTMQVGAALLLILGALGVLAVAVWRTSVGV